MHKYTIGNLPLIEQNHYNKDFQMNLFIGRFLKNKNDKIISNMFYHFTFHDIQVTDNQLKDCNNYKLFNNKISNFPSFVLNEEKQYKYNSSSNKKVLTYNNAYHLKIIILNYVSNTQATVLDYNFTHDIFGYIEIDIGNNNLNNNIIT